MTSHYLEGLNQPIRDKMRLIRLFNLTDARQYALTVGKKCCIVEQGDLLLDVLNSMKCNT